jgi:hypothetical protein
MPLIRAVREWIARRVQVREPYYPTRAPETTAWGGMFWIVLVLIGLPLIALLFVIGLVYEGVIRIDGRRVLPGAAHWTIAAAIGVAIGLAAGVLVLSWL